MTSLLISLRLVPGRRRHRAEQSCLIKVLRLSFIRTRTHTQPEPEGGMAVSREPRLATRALDGAAAGGGG